MRELVLEEEQAKHDKQAKQGAKNASASLPHCCTLCGKTKSELAAGEKLRSCSGCGVARYCSGACQKTAWPGHKKECQRLNKNVQID